MNYMNRILLILIILLIAISNFFPFIFIENRESTIFEVLQAFLILIIIIVHIKSRKLYSSFSNNITFILKLLFFSFLFYEEISFFTLGNTNYLTEINSQSEINFHNLNFLADTFLKIEIPPLNYNASIDAYVILVTCALFIIGYGSYFKLFKNFRYFFLEKNYSFYSYIFIINYVLSSLIKKLINPNMTLMHFEFVELFIYFLFLIDNLKKRNILKLKINS